MRAKAKSSSTPYPIWVEGEYITEPPIRPSDGAVRPAGHYIDKGGYPGANVYEVDINTMCRQTDAADRFGKPIYEQDILLYETAEEIGYFIVQDLETTVDIVNGEIIEVGDLDTENIKNIGSMVDYSDFVEGIRYHADNGLEMRKAEPQETQSLKKRFRADVSQCQVQTLQQSYEADQSVYY